MSNTSTGEIVDLTLDTFETHVIRNEDPILIDFWAPWCGPCRLLAPILAEAAGQLSGIARVGKVNVDEHPAIADAFGVRGIPTLVLMRGREVLDAFTGVLPAQTLVDRVKERLAK